MNNKKTKTALEKGAVLHHLIKAEQKRGLEEYQIHLICSGIEYFTNRIREILI